MNKYKLVIERITFDNLSQKNINNNNNPIEIIPSEYDKVYNLNYETEVARTNLVRWKNIINYPIIFEYTFTKSDIDILKRSCNIGIISGRIPLLYKEELEIIIKNLNKIMLTYDSEYGWFVRFNRASPKDGVATFPLMTPEHVIRQIVTSKRALQCLSNDDATMYFCKFDPLWNSERELRVFIYDGNITGISQYVCSDISDIFSIMSNEQISTIADNSISSINMILQKLVIAFGTKSFVCDIYVNEDLSVRIIEFNSFGYWLAAGSCLFNWKSDYEKLYNKNDNIYFRIFNIN